VLISRVVLRYYMLCYASYAMQCNAMLCYV